MMRSPAGTSSLAETRKRRETDCQERSHRDGPDRECLAVNDSPGDRNCDSGHG